MFIVGAALFINSAKKIMFIVGAAPFINGRTIL